jgi:putative endopeptidase
MATSRSFPATKDFRVKRYLLSTLTLSLMAAFAAAPRTMSARRRPRPPASTPSTSTSVRVQDDFFTYLNGKWLQDDRDPVGPQGELGHLHEAARRHPAAAARHHRSGPEEATRRPAATNRRSATCTPASWTSRSSKRWATKPLAGELQRIRALKDKKGVPALVAHLSQIGVATPYGIGVAQDAKESTKYATYIRQGGLGMPDRDYYLKLDDKRMADTRAKYEQHVANILALAGDKDAAAKAKAIVAFETELAKVQWTKVELRDPNKSYNKMSVAELAKLTPGYDWKAALAAAGVGNKLDYVIVGQPSYLTGFNEVLAKTDLATVKAYFEWQLLREYAPYLSKAFVDERLRLLRQDPDRRDRKPSALEAWRVDRRRRAGRSPGPRVHGPVLPAERKARMEELVKNVLAAYKRASITSTG